MKTVKQIKFRRIWGALEAKNVSRDNHSQKFGTNTSFHLKKADLFNSFFAKQCSIIVNYSALPSLTIPITDQYLANIEFMKDDIKRIICKLDPNKAHGHDIISIRMLKMSNKDIIEPLFKVFKNGLANKIILILAKKLKSYYLAKKQVPNHTYHWILVTILFTMFNSKSA